MNVDTSEVTSTEMLVKRVLEIGRSLGPEHPTWMRGHTCKDHTLKAGLPRQIKNLNDLLPMEQRLITRFRQRSLPHWPAGYPQNDWEQLFAMQHFGLPTRLLDWSENLFTALFFASRSHNHPVDGSATACTPHIWILDPVGWNRQSQLSEFESEIGILSTDDEDLAPYAPVGNSDLKRRPRQSLAIYGSHNSPRILAQRGTFTVTGNSLDSMESFTDKHSNQSLWRINLNYEREDMRSDLKALGFFESMIFPDLASVATEIKEMEGLQ